MISLVALAALQVGSVYRQIDLPQPGGGAARLAYFVYEDDLPKPKASPKKFGAAKLPFEFSRVTPGFVRARTTDDRLSRRFVVYGQGNKSDANAAAVVRMLLRIWDTNKRKYRLDHTLYYNEGTVDVYLCDLGLPGGEQRFDEDIIGGRPIRVNTVYVYDLPSFTDPIERAREVAHEYGHASLPPVGGFETPEDWANGYLGEKLYLRNLRDQFAAKELLPEDAMGASLDDLDKWVKANVDPLIVSTSTRPPDVKVLAGKGAVAMDAYMGLALYMESVLPPAVFVRSMILNATAKAADYPAAILRAVGDQKNIRVSVPDLLKDRPLWLPVGKGSVSGTRILKRVEGWVQVQPAPVIILLPG